MRLKTPIVEIRNLKIGGESRVAIQAMTDTDTEDATATAKQCILLANAGAELVRITVNTEKAAEKVSEIRKILDKKGYKSLPIIGDFHFNGHILLSKYPKCASTLDKYRINPGNIGHGKFHDENFKKIIRIAVKNNKPIRIGVNCGSLDQDLLSDMMNKNTKSKNQKSAQEILMETMVESALKSARHAEKIGLKQNQIVLSVKVSNVNDAVKAYELLAKKMAKNKRIYALHVGLTEAGSDVSGIVSSSCALGILLNKGIGDTIRVSITPTKNHSRVYEVEVCKAILQSLDMRYFAPQVTSCPGCGRTNSKFFQELAEQIKNHISAKIPKWKIKYHGMEKIKIAVMGCVVNGIGESKHADISISLPGKNEKKTASIYVKGKLVANISGDNIFKQFMKFLEKYVQSCGKIKTR